MPTKMQISVIIPAYNASMYIHKCLDSLVNQTLRKDQFEVIVVDDCSTDDTVEIAKNYASRYPNFRLICHGKNSRQGAARNTGIKNSEGQFIFFLDSDDRIREDALETCLIEQRRCDADLVFGDILVVDQFGQPDRTIYRHHETNSNRVEILTKSYYIWNILIRKELLTKNGILFEEQVFHEDILFAYLIVFNASRISSTNTPTYIYGVHDNSTINTYSDLHLKGIINAFVKMMEFLNKRGEFSPNLQLLRAQFLRMMEVTSSRIISFSETPQRHFQELARQLNETGLPKYFGVSGHPVIKQLYSRAARLAIPAPFHILSDYLAIEQIIYSYDLAGDKSSVFINITCTSRTEMEKMADQLKLFCKSGYPFNSYLQKEGATLLLTVQARRMIANTSLGRYCFGKTVFVCTHNAEIPIAFRVILECQKIGVDAFILDISEPTVYVSENGQPLPPLPEPGETHIQIYTPETTQELPLSGAAAVVFMDDNKNTRTEILAINAAGVPTVGIYLGIHDDLWFDNPGSFQPYRAFRYIILPGEYYRKYFSDKQVIIAGIPGLTKKLSKTVVYPNPPRVTINCNYPGVNQPDWTSAFLDSCVDACRNAGVDYYVIKAGEAGIDMEGYSFCMANEGNGIDPCSILISNCSPLILDCLVQGKPVIYHNPQGDQPVPFKDCHGALYCIKTTDELTSAIIQSLEEIRNGVDFREKASIFLDLHTNAGSSIPAEVSIALNLKKILSDNESSFAERKENLALRVAEISRFNSEHEELQILRKELAVIRSSKWMVLRNYYLRVMKRIKNL